MSGFAIRRFILQNITAVAAHCPSPGIAATAATVMTSVASPSSNTPASSPSASAETTSQPRASPRHAISWLHQLLVSRSSASPSSSAGGSFGLVSESEMEWIRQRRRDDAEESRVVLSTRPSRSLLRGATGAVVNIAMAFLVSPLIFLSVTFEKLRLGSGPSALLIAPCFGVLWSSLFFTVALYAAAQQAVLSTYYAVVATPLYFCLGRRTAPQLKGGGGGEEEVVEADGARPRFWMWNVLRCAFEAAQGQQGTPHAMLAWYDASAVLQERAMKRLHRSRQGRSDRRRSASYTGRQGGSGGEEGDYYELLGVSREATARQIKEAFNQKVLKVHPDRNPNPDAARRFDEITKAYRVLSNAQQRKKYDIGGAKGVEDTGAKKREGVRALFGGEELNRLAGDIFLGSFSRRVIDGLDYTAEELAVLRQRMYEDCRDELLSCYLTHYRNGASERATKVPENAGVAAAQHRKSASSLGSSATVGASQKDPDLIAKQLRRMLNTGLAAEVLYVIGLEYRRVLTYYDMEVQQSSSASPGAAVVSVPALVMQRALYYIKEVAPHRWDQQRQRAKYLLKVRSQTFKNPEAMVDLAWHSSVQEIETTARWVALSVLYDPALSSAEVAWRREALSAVADAFIKYGRGYKGATKSTTDQLMSSMREYQQQRQREKEEK